MAPKTPKTKRIRVERSKSHVDVTLMIQRVKGFRTRNRKPKTLRDIFFSRHLDIVNQLRERGATYSMIRQYLKRYHGFKPSKQYCESLLREHFKNESDRDVKINDES